MERETLTVLIVDPDRSRAAEIEAGLGAPSSWPQRLRDFVPRRSGWVGSLAALAAEDLSQYSMVLCEMELEDGTGMDALAYIRGARPLLPVLLVSSDSDPSLAIEAIRAGAEDCVVRRGDFTTRLSILLATCVARHHLSLEREHLQRRLSQSVSQLADEVTQLQAMISHLEVAAVTDELTGLNNRRRLNLALEHQWNRGERHGEPLALLMIDVDRFKDFNDQLGHQAGDTLLRLLSRVLRENCRQTDIIARYGGDEFCIVMPHVEIEDAIRTAERIVHAFERAADGFPVRGAPPSLSVGIAHTDLSGPDHVAQLVAHADEAMYAAKRTGGRVTTRRRAGVRAECGPRLPAAEA